jgi:hypothetical protein
MPLQDPTPHIAAFYLEAMIQACLHVVEETTVVQPWHRPAVYTFIAAIRPSVSTSLPGFSNYGLNRAWSLRQGGFKVPKEIREQSCRICGNRNTRMYLQTRRYPR